jgi:hypothetical protein
LDGISGVAVASADVGCATWPTAGRRSTCSMPIDHGCWRCRWRK